MLNYNKIYDFNNNRFVNLYSQRGVRILNSYLLNNLIGGSSPIPITDPPSHNANTANTDSSFIVGSPIPHPLPFTSTLNNAPVTVGPVNTAPADNTPVDLPVAVAPTNIDEDYEIFELDKSCPLHKPKFCANWSYRKAPCISANQDCKLSKELHRLAYNDYSSECVIDGEGEPCN